MAINDVNDGDVLEEADWDSVIDTVEDIVVGHEHDGTDSNVVYVLNVSGNPVKYVTSDMTASTHTGDTTESSMTEMIIPANSVSTGIIIRATAYRYNANSWMSWRLKIGAASSEVLKLTQTQDEGTQAGENYKVWMPIQWHETGQTWTNPVSVVITAELEHTSDVAGLQTVIIEGY